MLLNYSLQLKWSVLEQVNNGQNTAFKHIFCDFVHFSPLQNTGWQACCGTVLDVKAAAVICHQLSRLKCSLLCTRQGPSRSVHSPWCQHIQRDAFCACTFVAVCKLYVNAMGLKTSKGERKICVGDLGSAKLYKRLDKQMRHNQPQWCKKCL